MNLQWENGIGIDELSVKFPNAMLSAYWGFNIKLDQNSPSSILNIDWTKQKVSIFKGDDIFVNTTDLAMYVNHNILAFPNRLFVLSNGDLVEGVIEVEIELNFNSGETLFINGSVYSYGCDDIMNKNFNATDCRWPSQIIEPHGVPFPC